MKNISNLGKTLEKTAQKKIHGGFDPTKELCVPNPTPSSVCNAYIMPNCCIQWD